MYYDFQRHGSKEVKLLYINPEVVGKVSTGSSSGGGEVMK